MLHTRGVEDGHRADLERVAAEAQAAGAQVVTAAVDLATDRAGENVVATTLAQFGRLDQLVSNAGFAQRVVSASWTVPRWIVPTRP